MALKDDKPRILAELAKIEGVKQALSAWPKDWGKLPCVVVSLASNQPVEYRDDREYVTELEYYVRVFAAKEAERADVASKVDDAMLSLGYTRGMHYEEDGEGIRQMAMRYAINL